LAEDDGNVQFVLDQRRAGGGIEYLVRYADQNSPFDVWEKASDLTCYKKIIDFYDGKNPPDLVPRLPESTPIEVPQESPSNLVICRMEKKDGVLCFWVRLPNEVEPVLKSFDELRESHSMELIKYLEQNQPKGQ
jgi:hypothetical protein